MTPQWFNDHPYFINLLPLLTAVTNLVICGNWMYLDWELLTPEWRIALYDLMARPQISCLKLSEILNINLVPFAHFGHLNKLFLKNIAPDTSLKDGAPFPLALQPFSRRSKKIQSLRVGACGEALDLLLSTMNNGGSFDISHVTDLSVGTYCFDEEKMADPWMSLLDLCCKNLQKYRVIYEMLGVLFELTSFHPSLLNLQRFPNLVDFSILLDFKRFAEFDCFPMPQVLAAFDGLSKPSNPISLTTIKIEFKFDVPDATDSLYSFVAEEEFWGNLDEVLARPAFSRLRELWINFCSGNTFLHNEDWPATSGLITSEMPESHRKGILKLTAE
ncbi:hypothetical protein EST38_g7359 [Candolleomyces aberdarensis]|uniref:Uncharacterized protein n=1 Tax=Candolleomyces aberdarensis TaxID=2316362 RepID=A0A4Q2DIM7_9AGAR|nr:hypothetical protein EST38_g7359 [Candolleomyces aberdarensis]